MTHSYRTFVRSGVSTKLGQVQSSQNNRSADLVAALEGGLMFTLQNAVNVLWKPAGTLGEQWLNEQDEKLGPEGPAKPQDGAKDG